MRIHSTQIRPQQQFKTAPKQDQAPPETCTPEVQDRVSDLLFKANDARKSRSLKWAGAVLGGVAAVALAGNGNLGLSAGLAVGAISLGVLGTKDALSAASLTIEAADLASEHGCQFSTEPKNSANDYILVA